MPITNLRNHKNIRKIRLTKDQVEKAQRDVTTYLWIPIYSIGAPPGKVGDCLWVQESFRAIPRRHFPIVNAPDMAVDAFNPTTVIVYEAGWNGSLPTSGAFSESKYLHFQNSRYIIKILEMHPCEFNDIWYWELHVRLIHKGDTE